LCAAQEFNKGNLKQTHVFTHGQMLQLTLCSTAM